MKKRKSIFTQRVTWSSESVDSLHLKEVATAPCALTKVHNNPKKVCVVSIAPNRAEFEEMHYIVQA